MGAGVIEEHMTKTKIRDNGYAFVITPATVFGSDVVIHPKLDRSDPVPRTIDYYVLNAGDVSKAEADKFNALVAEMKAGKTGTGSYTLDGATWFLTYAPVSVKMSVYDTTDPNTYPTPQHDTLVYSVGLTVPETDITRPFEEVKDSISGGMVGLVVVCIILLGIVSVISAIVGGKLCTAIVTPLQALVVIVHAINDRELDAELPKIEGGSKEVTAIFQAFERLFTVVKFSNAAFFGG
jgi:hypothetical protein